MNLKKFLSFMLVLLMAASIFPMSAFARHDRGVLKAPDYERVRANIYVKELTLPTDNEPNTNGWGRPYMNYLGGWHHGESWRKIVYTKDSYNGPVLYCIEPGVNVQSSYQYSDKDESYWQNYPSNVSIDANTIKSHIGRVFQYGYTGNGNLNWVSTNSTHAAQMGHAIATQLLVWEIIVGERDANFNKIDATTLGNYNNVIEEVASNNPIRSQIFDYYNSMVYSVKAHLKIPSFCTKSQSSASLHSMEWNGSEYSITLTDENNVLDKYEFSSSDSNMSFTTNGNKLTIKSSTMPTTNAVITANRINSTRSSVVVWSDGNVGGGVQDMVHFGPVVPDPVKGYVKIKEGEGGNLLLKKTSEDGKISGIGFTFSSGDFSVHKATDANGNISVEMLNPGTYTVSEDDSPFYEPQTPKTVTIVSGETAEVNFNNTLRKGGLKVTKTADDGFVSGIKFRLFGTSDSGQSVDKTATTNDSGIATFSNIPIGTYTLEEIDVPAQYVVPVPQDVTISWNEVTAVTVNNSLQNGSIRGIKVDDAGMSLAGARIGLFAHGTTNFTEATAIQVKTSGTNGSFVFSNVPYGNYIVKELAAPDGYILSDEAFPVTVGETTNPISIEIVNVRARGSVKGVKVDDAGNKLAGAKIGIFAEGTTEFTEANAIATTTSKTNGSFSFSDLLYGNYIVKELAAPDGYILSDEAFPVTVGETTSPISIEIVNVLIRGSIKGMKLDDAGNALEGALIGLFAADETEFTEATALKMVKSAADGSFSFDDLPYGSYIVKEIAAPEGYILSDESFPAEIAENEQIIGIKIVNVLIRGSVKGMKLDDSGNALEDALIGLFVADETEFTENTAIMTVKSAADGSFSFNDLPYGSYIVKEIAAPEGYILSDEIFPVDINEQGAVIEVIIENTLIRGFIRGLKVSDSGNALEGALIGLFVADETEFTENTAIMTVKSAADGSFSFNDLPYGSYIVTEIAAPDGYVICSNIFLVEIKEQGDIIEIEITNKLIRGCIKGIKLDNSGNALEGALIGLFAADENEFTEATALMTVKSAADGSFSFDDLPYGSYIVKEISAPEGYILSDESFPVEITENEQVIGIKIINILIRGSVKGMKLDDAGNALEGALIGLFAADETEFTEATALKTVKSGNDGSFSFNDLSYGSYIVAEIAAPEGYILSDESFPVEITENEQIIGIKIVNVLIRGSIKGMKLDDAGNALEGALIGLFTADETEFTEATALKMVKSGSDGSFSFDDMPYGSYIVKEISAPEGYILSDESFTVNINEDGAVIEIRIINNRKEETPPPPPRTGGASYMPIALAIIFCGCCVLFVTLKKRKSNQEV